MSSGRSRAKVNLDKTNPIIIVFEILGSFQTAPSVGETAEKGRGTRLPHRHDQKNHPGSDRPAAAGLVPRSFISRGLFFGTEAL